MTKKINKFNDKYSSKTKQFFIILWILSGLLWILSCNDNNSLKNLPKKDDKNNKELYIEKENNIEWKKKVEKAKEEITKNWIPDFQKVWYVKDKSERAFNNITPQSYGDLAFNMKRYYRFKRNLGRDKDDLVRCGKWQKLEDGTIATENIYYQIPKRDDAFLIYLWMPQKHNSFGISDYQPNNSNDKEKIYFKLNYVSKVMKQGLLDEYFQRKKYDKDTTKIIMNERGDMFGAKRDSLEKIWIWIDTPIYAERCIDNPLWDFKVSEGIDDKWHYISIYDIRDLTPFQTWKWSSVNKEDESLSMIERLQKNWYNVNQNTEISSIFEAGKPFEIYDRIYYNPTTKKLIK